MRKALLLIFLVLNATAAISRTPNPISVQSSSVSGQGFIDLQLTITSHTELLTNALLKIEPLGDVLVTDITEYPMSLPKEVPVTVTIPFMVIGNSAYDSVRAAISATSGGPLGVYVFHFATAEPVVRGRSQLMNSLNWYKKQSASGEQRKLSEELSNSLTVCWRKAGRPAEAMKTTNSR